MRCRSLVRLVRVAPCGLVSTRQPLAVTHGRGRGYLTFDNGHPSPSPNAKSLISGSRDRTDWIWETLVSPDEPARSNDCAHNRCQNASIGRHSRSTPALQILSNDRRFANTPRRTRTGDLLRESRRYTRRLSRRRTEPCKRSESSARPVASSTTNAEVAAGSRTLRRPGRVGDRWRGAGATGLGRRTHGSAAHRHNAAEISARRLAAARGS
jgi:hypothetical protein